MNGLKFISKEFTIKNINKQLINKARELDPLVDENFYCRKLRQMDIKGDNIERLYNNVDKDIIKLMALLRGCQLGIVDSHFVYQVLDNPTDVEWLVDRVKIKLYKLLGLDNIEKICEGDEELYKEAVQKRLHELNYDETCQFVYSNKYKINKE